MFRDPDLQNACLVLASIAFVFAVLMWVSGCARHVGPTVPARTVHELQSVRGSWVQDSDAHPELIWMYTERTQDVTAGLKELGCGERLYCAPEFGGTITRVQTTPKH